MFIINTNFTFNFLVGNILASNLKNILSHVKKISLNRLKQVILSLFIISLIKFYFQKQRILTLRQIINTCKTVKKMYKKNKFLFTL